MNKFVEKVTELSLSLDITGWDALPREVNLRLLWVWAVLTAGQAGASRMPCACRISQVQLPLHCPGARAGQSKRAAASKCFLDGQELQIPHY